MQTPKHTLYRLEGKPAYIYAADETHAMALYTSHALPQPEAFNIDEITTAHDLRDFGDSDWADKQPLADPACKPPNLTCHQLAEILERWSLIAEAFREPSDFPVVPDMEPSGKHIEDLIADLLEKPSEVDWKLKGYLFLRFPKLRAAILDTSNDQA